MKYSASPLRVLVVSLGGFGVLFGLGLTVAVLMDRQYRAVASVATPLPSEADATLIKESCVRKIVQAMDLAGTGATRHDEQEDQVRAGLSFERDERAGRLVISVSWRDPHTAMRLAEQLADAFVEERNRAEKISLLARFTGPTLLDLQVAERSAGMARGKAIDWLAQHAASVLPEALRALLDTKHDAAASASIAARFAVLSPAGQTDHEVVEQAFFTELSPGLSKEPFRVSINPPNHGEAGRTVKAARKRLEAEVEAIRQRLEEETLSAGAAVAALANSEFAGLRREAIANSLHAKAIRSEVQTPRPPFKPVASILSVTGLPPLTPWWRHLTELPRSVWVCQLAGLSLLMFGLFGCPGFPARAHPPGPEIRQRPSIDAGAEVPDAW